MNAQTPTPAPTPDGFHAHVYYDAETKADAEALRESHKAVKEYLGYVVYWLRGWV